MNNKIKLLLVFLVLVIIFLVAVGLIGANREQIEGYFEDRRAERIYNEMLAEKTALEEKKRNDFAGGRTPEETIEIYLDALRKGDIDRARSYYDVEFQSEVLKDTEQLQTVIANVELMLNKGTKKCFVGLRKEDVCSWSIIRSDGLVMDIGLSKNINEFWKILR